MKTRFGRYVLSAVLCYANAGADGVTDGDDLRNELNAQGVSFGVNYVSETATNVRGGAEEMERYADQWAFFTTLDLERMVGLEQARFQITITDRNGRNLNTDANLGLLQNVQEIYGRGQTWHWTQFWFQQKYVDGLLDWKVGRLTGGEDFATFSCEFSNLTFCGPPPGNIATSAWYNWPVSQWATRLRASIPGFGYVQAGVYEANPGYLRTKYALDLGEPPGKTGLLVPLEIGWLPQLGGSLEGSYKLGGWYNSSQAPDAVDDITGLQLSFSKNQPMMQKDQYGTYVNFLQQVTTRSSLSEKRGLSVFFNATFADQGTSTVDNQIAAGTLYTGMLALRPFDELGAAIGRNHLNDRIATLENSQYPSRHVQGAEYVSEIFYSVHAARGMELRPNVQYIHRPGGVAQAEDDVILGIKVVVSL